MAETCDQWRRRPEDLKEMRDGGLHLLCWVSIYRPSRTRRPWAQDWANRGGGKHHNVTILRFAIGLMIASVFDSLVFSLFASTISFAIQCFFRY
jgi:hypothetical protein